ncbi:hypothetical protein QBC35DRAFT_290153 [Podospora australis]|uniref:BHLH domain-containing protein n=1 Tax=Podospora australis TaxID=1536484 RepID=A0AAN6WQG1_9PEZI|nr:hypothetical protein QBC35DRAFT_290153 [Podospora australis]
MQSEYAVDRLGLPRFDHMREHESVAMRGGQNRPPLPDLAAAHHQQSVDYPELGDVNSAFGNIDSAVDLSVSSTFDDLLDCDPALLEDWNPPPHAAHAGPNNNTNSHQWPSLPNPQSPNLPTPAASEGFRVATTDGTNRQRVHSDPCRVRKPEGSQRAHYAVEKRYRSTLNEKYAALARALSNETVQRVCKSKSPTWAFDAESSASTSDLQNDEQQQNQQQQGGGVRTRQRKTTTLSVVIETINILSVCCREEEKELEQLRSGVNAIRNSAAQLLHGTGTGPLPTPSPAQGQQQQTGAGATVGGGPAV